MSALAEPSNGDAEGGSSRTQRSLFFANASAPRIVGEPARDALLRNRRSLVQKFSAQSWKRVEELCTATLPARGKPWNVDATRDVTAIEEEQTEDERGEEKADLLRGRNLEAEGYGGRGGSQQLAQPVSSSERTAPSPKEESSNVTSDKLRILKARMGQRKGAGAGSGAGAGPAQRASGGTPTAQKPASGGRLSLSGTISRANAQARSTAAKRVAPSRRRGGSGVPAVSPEVAEDSAPAARTARAPDSDAGVENPFERSSLLDRTYGAAANSRRVSRMAELLKPSRGLDLLRAYILGRQTRLRYQSRQVRDLRQKIIDLKMYTLESKPDETDFERQLQEQVRAEYLQKLHMLWDVMDFESPLRISTPAAGVRTSLSVLHRRSSTGEVSLMSPSNENQVVRAREDVAGASPAREARTAGEPPGITTPKPKFEFLRRKSQNLPLGKLETFDNVKPKVEHKLKRSPVVGRSSTSEPRKAPTGAKRGTTATTTTARGAKAKRAAASKPSITKLASARKAASAKAAPSATAKSSNRAKSSTAKSAAAKRSSGGVAKRSTGGAAAASPKNVKKGTAAKAPSATATTAAAGKPKPPAKPSRLQQPGFAGGSPRPPTAPTADDTRRPPPRSSSLQSTLESELGGDSPAAPHFPELAELFRSLYGAAPATDPDAVVALEMPPSDFFIPPERVAGSRIDVLKPEFLTLIGVDATEEHVDRMYDAASEEPGLLFERRDDLDGDDDSLDDSDLDFFDEE